MPTSRDIDAVSVAGRKPPRSVNVRIDLINDEHIVFAARSHPIVLTGAFFRMAVMTVIAAVLVTVDIPGKLESFASKSPAFERLRNLDAWPIVLCLAVLVALSGILPFLLRYIYWKRDIWVVTTDRFYHRKGLFGQEEDEDAIETVSETERYTSPLQRTILDFATLEIVMGDGVKLEAKSLHHARYFKQCLRAGRDAHEEHRIETAMRRAAMAAPEDAEAGGVYGISPSDVADRRSR